MKSMKKILCFLLISIMCLGLFGGCGPSEPPKPNQAALEDIAIKIEPKTAYLLGEKFEIAGGVLELYFDDGSTKDLAFTAEGVTVSAPDMQTLGTKTVTVEYDGFTATYMITVANATCTVTFDLNYSGSEATTQSVVKGTHASRPTANPARPGYRFAGWFTDRDGDTEFDFSETEIASDTTVYAHWIEVCTVAFNFNYSDAPAAKEVQIDKGESLQEASAPSATRPGYLFAGWHTSATEDAAYSFGAPIETSFTLYAHWTEIGTDKTVFEVTFHYQYFDYEDKTVEVIEGEQVAEPQRPTGDGRTFAGWFTEADGGDEYDFGDAVTQSFDLYAHWNIDQYVVTFNYVIDGTVTTLRTRKVSPGKTVSAGTTPIVEGYKFVAKWYTDPEYTSEFDFSTPVNQDYTLYIKPLKENKFEAEFTYIDEKKAGVGSSDNFSGLKLIFVDNGTASASNGYWVSGLYYNTAFIEFVITSDRDVTDAHLQLRLSAEWADMYLAPTTRNFGGRDYFGFEISSALALLGDDGGVQKDSLGYALFNEDSKLTFEYDPIAITGAITFEQSMVDKRPFTDYLMTTAFTLRKGVNVVRLTVTNSNPPYDGTMEASAPMIDCMSIFTDAVLTWDPVKENVADRSKLNG